MKKLLALLFIVLPLSLAYVSCSDDDDLPDVSMSITVSNSKVLGDTIFVVQGDSLIVDAINIQNNEQGKNALITFASYQFINEIYKTPYIPFYWARPTSTDPQSVYYIPVGVYPLTIQVDIAAEDKALAFGVLPYMVRVVASPDDIPANATTGVVKHDNQYVKKK